jgi:hypothetical protein
MTFSNNGDAGFRGPQRCFPETKDPLERWLAHGIALACDQLSAKYKKNELIDRKPTAEGAYLGTEPHQHAKPGVTGSL